MMSANGPSPVSKHFIFHIEPDMTSDDMLVTSANLRHALMQIAFGADGNAINKAVVVLSVSADGHIQMQSVQGQFLKQGPGSNKTS